VPLRRKQGISWGYNFEFSFKILRDSQLGVGGPGGTRGSEAHMSVNGKSLALHTS
jgi:hypothetical protein